MYKKKSSLILLVFVLLLCGFTSRVFAIDFSSALKQSAQDTETATSLFDGKAQVGDLYNQALKIVKQNETAATDAAINSIVAYYTAKSCSVRAQDVMHILYVSNLGFKTFLDHMVLSSITTTRSLPTSASIDASYRRFFTCGGITKPTANDYINVQNSLISLYYQSINGVFYSSTLAQDNVGEDLFRNGSTDDSAFDLMADINTIGDLFFSTFKKSPEVLFYRLPTAVAGTNGGNNGGTNNGNGGTNNGVGGTSTTGATQSTWVRGIGVPPSPAPLGTKPTVSPAETQVSAATVSKDVDVQQFLTTTNPSTFVQSDYSFLVGNACADVTKLPPSQAAVQEVTQDPETYISGIVTFIEQANTDEAVQAVLLSGFHADLAAAQKTNPTTATQSIANSYAEMAFGEGNLNDGSCESSCNGLTDSAYLDCQLGCAKSCIQTCDDLPLDDKLLCVTDCSCKMISGPQGAGRDKIEDMFSIKFCKQPVQPVSTPAKKTVNNLESILQSFLDALQGLKSSGQTIKMKKTKEFLDIGISLNMADLLDFKIFVAFKPIFAQTSDAAKKREKVLENDPIVKSTINMSATPESENYNKYVIVSNIAKNSAELQPVADTASSEASFQTAQAMATASLQNPIQLYQQQKNALLSEDVISFLQSHIAFWDHLFSVSVTMLQDATNLREKIENSN